MSLAALEALEEAEAEAAAQGLGEEDEDDEHVEESSPLWQAILALPRPAKTVHFPRKGVDGAPLPPMRMIMLTQNEQSACVIDATKFARYRFQREPESSLGFQSLYALELAIQVLYRACRRVESNNPVFPPPDVFRTKIMTEDVAFLIGEYTQALDELGAPAPDLVPT